MTQKCLMIRNSYSCIVRASSRYHILAHMHNIHFIFQKFHRDDTLSPMVASPHKMHQVHPMLSPSAPNIFLKFTRISKTQTTIIKQTPNTKRLSYKTNC